MKQKDFKKRLDNREFWGDNTNEMWDAAYKWQEQANKEDDLLKWSWDCGLKLDYDGYVLQICSRFYPPHKSEIGYGKYHGTISVLICGSQEDLSTHEIEAETLDELKKLVEDYVSKTIDKVKNALKSIF